ncbi:MAG: hypothetical protein ABFS56_32210 [Pseudomonadota bacterium]
MDNLFIHFNDIKNLILRSNGIRLQDIAKVIDAPPTERTQMLNAISCRQTGAGCQNIVPTVGGFLFFIDFTKTCGEK